MSNIITKENEKTDSNIMSLDQNFVLEMAKLRAIHSLEFVEIGTPPSDEGQKEALKSCRDAVVKTINSFGEEFVEKTVDFLQDRGILPGSVNMGDFQLKELNQDKVLMSMERVVQPLEEIEGPITKEDIELAEQRALEEMVSYCYDQIIELDDLMLDKSNQVEDRRLLDSLKKFDNDYLIVDVRDGLPDGDSLVALSEIAWGGKAKAITMITKEGEESDSAAGYKAVLDTETNNFYVISDSRLASMDKDKKSSLEQRISSGKAFVAGRSVTAKEDFLSLLKQVPALEKSSVNKDTMER